MNSRQLLAIILIAFFIGAAGSIVVGRFLIPYVASVSGWETLNKLVTSAPIIINRTNEVQLNEGVNLIDLTKQASSVTVSFFSVQNPTFLGNGIVMTSDGLIITSKSVVGGNTGLTAVLNNGNSYTALVRAVDPKSDIAVVTIEERNLNVPSFADGFGLNAGQRVLILGQSNLGFNRKLAQGFVSNTAMNYKVHLARTYSTEVMEDMFEIDAAGNTGEFVGSPIINLNGRLVGMVTGSSLQKIVIAENLQSALASYLNSGKIIRPRLGVTYFQLSNSMAGLRGLSKPGVLVAKVDVGSPAAGKIQVNDLIFEVDGRNIENESFEQVINRHAIGEIRLKLIRSGQEMEVVINLEPTK